MLSNILSIIERVAQEQIKSNNIDNKKIAQFFGHYKRDTWLYPSVIKRVFSISTSETYHFLNGLEKEGIIKPYYELYCPRCSKTYGIVESINQIPDYFECEICNEELSGIENSVVIYKVIRDE